MPILRRLKKKIWDLYELVLIMESLTLDSTYIAGKHIGDLEHKTH